MKKISWQLLTDWGACYNEQKLQATVPHPMTLLELLELKIPGRDRRWVLDAAYARGYVPKEWIDWYEAHPQILWWWPCPGDEARFAALCMRKAKAILRKELEATRR